MGKESKLSKEPYKGVRDFYPEDMAIQNYIFNTMRKTAENFGYEEYNSSILEPSEIYDAKSGDELAEQNYRFKDKSNRKISLRPEMTPTLARMVAKKRNQLTLPIRFYSIANIFRYERPQKGRLREHWQLNTDIFGVNGVEAEKEIIYLAHQLLRNFNAKEEHFKIEINSRTLIRKLFSHLKIGKNKTEELIRLLDNKEKMKKDDFEKKVKELTRNKTEKTLEWLNSKDFFAFQDNLPEELQKSPEIRDLSDLFQTLEKMGVNNAIFNPCLTRGLDYYTGTVFEIFDTNPENKRSLMGGGRYDNLLELFDTQNIPAVGFGAGDVTLKDFLEGHNLLPTYTPAAKIYVCTISDKYIPQAFEIADSLRRCDINIALNLTSKKVGDQIKIADKKSIPYVMFVGEEEVGVGKYRVKELKTGKEKELTENEIVDLINAEH